MPVYHISDPKSLSNTFALLRVFDHKQAHPIAICFLHDICSRVHPRAMYNQLTHEVDVMIRNSLRIGQFDSYPLGHSYFVDAQVWIGTDDCSSGKVDTLPR